VPFLRFSRDKRGYEHVYLVHAHNRRGKPTRPRVLYWYRTPPGIKVGRQPFDEEVQRTLEAQNPGVIFDWKAIIATPMPPPETEHWRERRRVERAAKQAQRADDEEVEAPLLPSQAVEIELAEVAFPAIEAEAEVIAASDAVPVTIAPVEDSIALRPQHPASDVVPRKRRRRGGRRRHGRSELTGAPLERLEGVAAIKPIQQPVEPIDPIDPFEPDEPTD
jgi:hypothetical protein